MAKVTATVKGSPLLHNGKRYDIGATIELDEAQAENLGIYLDIEDGNKQTSNKQTGNKQTDGAKKTQQKDAGKGDESKVE